MMRLILMNAGLDLFVSQEDDEIKNWSTARVKQKDTP